MKPNWLQRALGARRVAGTSALVGALFCALAGLGAPSPARAQETVGGGTVLNPAQGPVPSFNPLGSNLVLVKNWHFGSNGTIKNQGDMNGEFLYHDQFGTINNGGKYGSNTVAPDAANAIGGQPIEGVNCPPVRAFTADSLKTFLQPLDGANPVSVPAHNVGNGSFMAKWRLPKGGQLLGRDIVWETRMRYDTPPYFWVALWTAGNKWKWDPAANNGQGEGQGAEHDLMEGFGYDNGNGNTNYDGRYWHSNTVAWPMKDAWNFWDWSGTMAAHGFPTFDPLQYHTWTWVYKRDNSFAMYCDGKLIQQGADYWWTFGNTKDDEPLDMDFLFDAGWGHNQIGSVNKTMDPALLAGKYFEFAYSRVYLSNEGQAAFNGPHALPGTVKASEYDLGGQNVAFNQTQRGGQSGFRADNSGALYPDGTNIGWTSAGQWYKYTVQVASGAAYDFSFRVASGAGGGTFHLEDELGRNLTGAVSFGSTGGWGNFVTVNAPSRAYLSTGGHTLKWVQDSGGYDVLSLSASKSTASGTSCASFVKTDAQTQGNWKGVYGADGYNVFGDNSSNNPKQPSYGTTGGNGWVVTWAGATTDGRALQKATSYGADYRVAAQMGSNGYNSSYDIDCNLTDNAVHQVALYALDWDYNGRYQVVQVLDAASGAMLDCQTITNFTQGVYYIWNVKGHVVLRVINKTNGNPATAGVFLDPVPTAGTVSNLYSTGVDNANADLNDGNSDGHWTVSSGSAPNPAKVVNGGTWLFQYWVANTSSSRWIAPAANEDAGPDAPGQYVYSTNFSVSNPGSLTIQGRFATDDALSAIKINGQTVSGVSTGGFGGWTSFSIGSGLVSGTNTLQFVTNNLGSGPNPDGLQVQFGAVTSSAALKAASVKTASIQTASTSRKWPVLEKSKLAMSTSSVSASNDQIQLFFAGGINTQSAQNARFYQVRVGGAAVPIAGVTSNGSAVTLTLNPGTLHTSDPVGVKWAGLLDLHDKVVIGGTSFVAR